MKLSKIVVTLSLCLTLALSILFTGCGKTSANNDAESTTTTDSTTAAFEGDYHNGPYELEGVPTTKAAK